MSGPTGLIFALRPTYGNDVDSNDASAANAFYDEANTGFSAGAGAMTAFGANLFFQGTSGEMSFHQAAALADAEEWGSGSDNDIPSMSFNIDKSQVTAKTRALKAEYSVKLAQDLKAIHGLDAETKLANILTTEIMLEIQPR
ncbi:hypothetical protein, partial [Mesorhizobium sp. M6A.T.Cr.TU.017.01.1.1]|uniref:hypothetical protein n=1 Tax=Mesorhizobium sp. M6A.T.Cr.TU.017.01.1.1 TaxID=2496774 RepID=UPI001FE22215